MTLKSQLERVVRDVFLVKPTPYLEDTPVIVLDEKKAPMQVEITDIHPDTVAIRTVPNVCQLGLLRKEGNLRKICDYILIGRIGNTWHAVLIEMKKTLADADEERPKEQLRRSLPLLEYILCVCKIEFLETDSRPEISYLLLSEKYHPRFAKQNVKPTRTGFVDRILWKSIEIRRFVGHRFKYSDLVGG